MGLDRGGPNGYLVVMGENEVQWLRREQISTPVVKNEDWLSMYLSGKSAREIASEIGVHPNAVHNRLRKLVRQDQGLAVTHSANRAQLAEHCVIPGRTFWLRRLEEVHVYLLEKGSLPHPHLEDPDHARMGRWLDEQRRRWQRGGLCGYRVNMLDRIGEWRRTYRQVKDSALFRTRLSQLENFVSRHRRFPSYRPGREQGERELGIWLHGRRIAANKGTLVPQDKQQLDATAPGWRKTSDPKSSGHFVTMAV